MKKLSPADEKKYKYKLRYYAIRIRDRRIKDLEVNMRTQGRANVVQIKDRELPFWEFPWEMRSLNIIARRTKRS